MHPQLPTHTHTRARPRTEPLSVCPRGRAAPTVPCERNAARVLVRSSISEAKLQPKEFVCARVGRGNSCFWGSALKGCVWRPPLQLASRNAVGRVVTKLVPIRVVSPALSLRSVPRRRRTSQHPSQCPEHEKDGEQSILAEPSQIVLERLTEVDECGGGCVLCAGMGFLFGSGSMHACRMPHASHLSSPSDGVMAGEAQATLQEPQTH